MPGSTPATSQLDWLSSTTAMIVLSWSKATRDLLKSFSWGIGALRQLFASDDGAISFAACPIPSLRWREPDSNHRSRVRESGRCQVPAIRPGSVEHLLWEEVLSLPWRAETSNSRSRRKTSVLRPMISARTARIDDNLGRGDRWFESGSLQRRDGM